jgi:hypothetical protein
MSRWLMNRRHFLAGSAKTLISLPLLEAMFLSDKALAQAATGINPRFAFLYYSNGSVAFENSATSLDSLTGMLAPLAPYRSHLISVNGLSNKENSAWDNNGGGGGGTPHETEAATFLTCNKLGSLGDLKVSPSMDQVIGSYLQAKMGARMSSLVIGDGIVDSGIGQGGINRAYHHLMSWKSATSYVAPFMSINAVFKEVFSGVMPTTGTTTTTNAELAKLQAQKKSILDASINQVAAMKQRLGVADQARLDQYLSGVREVEIKVAAVSTTTTTNGPLCPAVSAPTDYSPFDPSQFQNYIHTMIDLITVAFQCQITPSVSYMFTRGNGGVRSGVGGVVEDQHEVSHYKTNGTADKLRKVNTFYNSQFAYYVKKLSETMELDQPLIKNVVSLYGCSTSDSDDHDGGNCTAWIAGGQNHGVITNRVMDYGMKANRAYNTGTPLANLMLGLSNIAGVGLTSFGNSKGAINLKA